MIPKKIHYCWFGQAELPPLAEKCIASWKKYLPDYEIIEWNESNFDINCCDYIKEAYQAKKWAFVSDYARFKILYEQGGIYFDTDVEVIKDLSPIIEAGAFLGIEKQFDVNPGLGIAVEPQHPLYKEFLDSYQDRHFVNNDGSLNLKTIVEYTTELLQEHGLSKDTTKIQTIDGIHIYPKDYFNPSNMDTRKIEITENTYTIHHYAASWVSRTERFCAKVYWLIARIFGAENAKKLRKLLHM